MNSCCLCVPRPRSSRPRCRRRVTDLVHAELRRFNLTPETPVIEALVTDLMRRLTGLGFLDALLPPVRS